MGMAVGVILVYALGHLTYRVFVWWGQARRAASINRTVGAVEDYVVSAVCGPDATGRCRQCGCEVEHATVTLHARLFHDRSRPLGAEDDPAFWPPRPRT